MALLLLQLGTGCFLLPTSGEAKMATATLHVPGVALLRGSPQPPFFPQSSGHPFSIPAPPLHPPSPAAPGAAGQLQSLEPALWGSCGAEGLRASASGSCTVWPLTTAPHAAFIFRSPCIWHLDLYLSACSMTAGFEYFVFRALVSIMYLFEVLGCHHKKMFQKNRRAFCHFCRLYGWELHVRCRIVSIRNTRWANARRSQQHWILCQQATFCHVFQAFISVGLDLFFFCGERGSFIYLFACFQYMFLYKSLFVIS